MTIYFASNDINDIAGGQAYDTTAGRFDADYVTRGIRRTSLSQGTWPLHFAHSEDNSADSEAWFHFEMWADRVADSTSDDGSWLRLVGDGGKILAYIDTSNGANNLRVYDNGGGNTSAGATFLLSPDVLNVYDLMYKDDLTTCTFELYINGALISSITRASTGTRTMPRTLQFDNSDFTSANISVVYSQFIIANESTVGMKMKEVRPNAVGNYTDLAADVTAVDDDDPSSGWVGDTNAQKQSFTITGFTLPAGRAVHSVNVQADVRVGPTGPQNLRPFVRIGGVDYDLGADIAPQGNSKRGIIGASFTTNPATTNAWTEAEIQSLEAGFEIKT